MVYTQPRFHSGECEELTSLGCWDTNRSPNLDQMTSCSDSQQKKKRTCRIVEFAIPADLRVKLKDSEKRDKYLEFVREEKKTTMEHEGDYDNSCNWCTWNNSQRIGKKARRLGNKSSSGDYQDYNTIKIDSNSEKSPWDLKRLAVTQTPMENPQQMLIK